MFRFFTLLFNIYLQFQCSVRRREVEKEMFNLNFHRIYLSGKLEIYKLYKSEI